MKSNILTIIHIRIFTNVIDLLTETRPCQSDRDCQLLPNLPGVPAGLPVQNPLGLIPVRLDSVTGNLTPKCVDQGGEVGKICVCQQGTVSVAALYNVCVTV